LMKPPAPANRGPNLETRDLLPYAVELAITNLRLDVLNRLNG